MRRTPLARRALAVVLVMPAACASPLPDAGRIGPVRSGFRFARDTFAFPNETVRTYDVAGIAPPPRRREESDDGWMLRCFVMSRAARQFFRHARFDPRRPPLDAAGYARLVDEITSFDPRADAASEPEVVIPGYASLRAFSRGQEAVLKSELGGAWQSFLQRGNWRMVLPISDAEEQATAAQLVAMLRDGRPPIVHVYQTSLAVNHAVLIYAADASRSEIVFRAYDPNDETKPLAIRFQRRTSRFLYPRTAYFEGGAVKLYTVYEGWLY